MKSHLTLVLLMTLLGAAPDVRSLKEPYPLKQHGLHMEATLALRTDRLRPSDRIEFDVRVTNLGGGGYVYNAMMNEAQRLPIALCVYSGDRYIGNFATRLGGEAMIGPSTWVYLSSQGYCGGIVTRLAGHVPGTEFQKRDHPLPKGKYRVQAVFCNAFIGIDSRSGRVFHPEDSDLLRQHFDGKELFRSNIAEFEIID